MFDCCPLQWFCEAPGHQPFAIVSCKVQIIISYTYTNKILQTRQLLAMHSICFRASLYNIKVCSSFYLDNQLHTMLPRKGKHGFADVWCGQSEPGNVSDGTGTLNDLGRSLSFDCCLLWICMQLFFQCAAALRARPPLLQKGERARSSHEKGSMSECFIEAFNMSLKLFLSVHLFSALHTGCILVDICWKLS